MQRSSNSKANSSRTSRYKVGVVHYSHRGKIVTSTVGSKRFDQYINRVSDGNYTAGRIPAGYEARPDLIAHLFFGKTDSWWKLMVINNISDPFEGLSPGDQLLLPQE